jgi:hypothetical protein
MCLTFDDESKLPRELREGSDFFGACDFTLNVSYGTKHSRNRLSVHVADRKRSASDSLDTFGSQLVANVVRGNPFEIRRDDLDVDVHLRSGSLEMRR